MYQYPDVSSLVADEMDQIDSLAAEITDDELDGLSLPFDRSGRPVQETIEDRLYIALRDAVEGGRDSLKVTREQYWLAADLYRLSQIEGLYLDDLRRAVDLVERMDRKADVIGEIAQVIEDRIERELIAADPRDRRYSELDAAGLV